MKTTLRNQAKLIHIIIKLRNAPEWLELTHNQHHGMRYIKLQKFQINQICCLISTQWTSNCLESGMEDQNIGSLRKKLYTMLDHSIHPLHNVYGKLAIKYWVRNRDVIPELFPGTRFRFIKNLYIPHPYLQNGSSGTYSFVTGDLLLNSFIFY